MTGILLILVLIAINAFFAASEIAVISARPVRIRQLAEEGHRTAGILLRLMDDPSRFLATIQVGITLAGFLASASAAVGLSKPVAAWLTALGLTRALADTAAVLAVTLAIAYLTLVLGELAPKRLALGAAERIALLGARPIAFVSRVTGPFTWFLTFSTNLVVRLFGGNPEHKDQTITEEELRFYVAEHQELQAEEKRLIEGVFDFGDRLVRQIMVPRPEMECIRAEATLDEAMQVARRTGYWRFPVYGEDYDDIRGVVTVKDLLYNVGEPKQVELFMRPALFVPEAKRALDLLKDMQAQDVQMAIVVDEYGGIAGLATLEDLLNEIVGEMGTGPEPPAGPTATEVELDGTATVEEVNERLDADIPGSPHYETLAGFIMNTLGAVPTQGAAVEHGEWRLQVERMEGRRVDLVRAVRLPPAGTGAEPAPGDG